MRKINCSGSISAASDLSLPSARFSRLIVIREWIFPQPHSHRVPVCMSQPYSSSPCQITLICTKLQHTSSSLNLSTSCSPLSQMLTAYRVCSSSISVCVFVEQSQTRAIVGPSFVVLPMLRNCLGAPTRKLTTGSENGVPRQGANTQSWK